MKRGESTNGGTVNGQPGTLSLDASTRRLLMGDDEVLLTPLECRLLEALLEQSGDSLTRAQLLQSVWNTDAELETRTVDMHVARLRSKLGAARGMIETVHGLGYRLRVDPELVTA